jgi:hypothetical protein
MTKKAVATIATAAPAVSYASKTLMIGPTSMGDESPWAAR